MEKPIVVLGTGLAGYGAARQLRRNDRELPLELITADEGRSYYKPDLSEALAKGKEPDQLAQADAEAMGEQLNARIHTHTRVTAIDRDTHQVHTEQGTFDYGRLVMAVGAQPRHLPLEGNAADRVLSVNDLGDYTRFRQALAGARRVAILGAGLVGCEFANDLASAGYPVDVVYPEATPLARFLPGQLGEALAYHLTEAGVRWHPGRVARRVDEDGGAIALRLDDDTTLKADVVLSAVGLVPDTALAAEAGLDVGRGIQVNRYLETSDPAIYALGDCAEVVGYVLPFVFPLMQAARALGKTLAGERTPARYPAMPVTVKTHVYPVSTLPPPEGVDGEWDIETVGEGFRARFYDRDGQPRGFALAGEAPVKETGRLSRELPGLF